MKLYLILLPVLYLIVSYIVMGILLLFVVALTTLQFPKENWWVFVVLLLLVGNVEVTGFKELKDDKKGVSILNILSLLLFVIFIILIFILY